MVLQNRAQLFDLLALKGLTRQYRDRNLQVSDFEIMRQESQFQQSKLVFF